MNVLIACEESQRVCVEFRNKGANAFSCDIIECSGGHPEWHILGDCLPLINGNCEFETMDGKHHKIDGQWDLLIAHPPCTYLTVTGNRWFNLERYGNDAIKRLKEREKAIDFFFNFVNAECERIAIENPVGVMSTRYRKPDQIIQPYFFGEPYRKATCLWLRNLPPLEKGQIVEPDTYKYISKTGKVKSDSKWRSKYKNDDRSKERSKTFLGIAKAMANQWGVL